MKYIRTIFNRIISYDENANDIDKPVILKYPSDIIKQADTIEELCDEIVAVLKIDLKGDRPYIVKSERPIEFVKKCNYVGFEKALIDYYGAIWTDKGLIYVAKMNDKGELVLL